MNKEIKYPISELSDDQMLNVSGGSNDRNELRWDVATCNICKKTFKYIYDEKNIPTICPECNNDLHPNANAPRTF